MSKTETNKNPEKVKGNRAYVLIGGRYILFEATKHRKSMIEYLTSGQVERINNLLTAKLYIDKEISLIKNSKYADIDTEKKPIDELIEDSALSNRVKNVFSNLGFKKISEISKHPFSKWEKWRNMGAGCIEETKKYLIKKGFILNEK